MVNRGSGTVDMIPDGAAKALQELKDEGLIEWNGEFRNGQKVYVITMKGIVRARQMETEGDSDGDTER
jgi:DNA-binding PadR family transcriptional regulator